MTTFYCFIGLIVCWLTLETYINEMNLILSYKHDNIYTFLSMIVVSIEWEADVLCLNIYLLVAELGVKVNVIWNINLYLSYFIVVY